jgi:hypothetical protein
MLEQARELRQLLNQSLLKVRQSLLPRQNL